MSKTILCVDDSVTMQKVAEITFHATEYQYVGARNADEGLAAAKKSRPALVLADAVMPGKTGYDLCQALKADPELSDVPVLMMCGNSQAYDPARGAEVGADGHVVKPWDTQVMLDKVEEVIGAGASAAPKAAAAPKPATPAPKPAPAAKSAPTPSPAPAAKPTPTPSPAPAAKPTPTPSPAPAAKAPEPSPAAKRPEPSPAPAAKSPSMPTPPEPPRSATIMGMPSLQLPPTKPESKSPSFTPATPVARPEPKPAPPPATPSATPSAPSGQSQIPTMPRPPMIKGTPTRRPNLSALQGGAASSGPAPGPGPSPMPERAPASPPMERALATAEAATAGAAADAARSAGLDPDGPEMAALLKLSRDVIERVVWEVVPELAETIIRENLDRLTAKAR